MALDVSPNGQGYLRFSFKIHPEMGRIGNGEMDGDRGKGEPTQRGVFAHRIFEGTKYSLPTAAMSTMRRPVAISISLAIRC
jgi:hypothetical protein